MSEDIFMSIFRGNVQEYFDLIPGVDVDACQGKIPLLHYALSQQDKYSEEIVLDLIHRGADINKTDDCGRTPLEICCWHHRMNIAKILLEKGALVNTVDKWGNNPLWRTVYKCDYEMVQLLMEYGADPNSKNKVDKSPLDFANTRNDEKMVAILTLLREKGE
ncbi:MAG: ankyrin repeat domain-containing protein [Paludibacteraceae bacterium]|nr:ankyrin repeat domain-containing protein [Paludibacteraceae bacterium]